MKPPSHPKDRRNIKFMAIALVIAGILFGILQYRQLREVESDVASSPTGFIKSK
jgi:hypothetical protein